MIQNGTYAQQAWGFRKCWFKKIIHISKQNYLLNALQYRLDILKVPQNLTLEILQFIPENSILCSLQSIAGVLDIVAQLLIRYPIKTYFYPII